MKKKSKNILTLILIILIVLIILFLFFIFPEIIGYVIKAPKKQVSFYFYDKQTNCPLNGYVFEGDELVGKSYDGYFNLTYENYQENFQNNENISIFGKMGSCFGKNEGLYFDKYWQNIKIEKYYFNGESLFNFEAGIDSNNPSKREFIGFVQPEKVKAEINKIELKGSKLGDLSAINQHLNEIVNYKRDWGFNKETNYWQTPTETLERKEGDCEDFSVALLSLFFAYDSSLNCYNIIFSSHVTTFCYVENYYIYYDQGKTEVKKQIDRNSINAIEQLKELKKDYLENYGIDIKNENETKAYYAFNDNSYTEFNSEDEFVNWQYSLKNEEVNLFEGLEEQALSVQRKYPANEEAELGTSYYAELPTLRGFFIDNLWMVFCLFVVLIVLVVVLIKINKKS